MTDNLKTTEKERSHSNECPYCNGRGIRLVLKSAPEIESMYGKGEVLEYAEKCEFCDGSALKKYAEAQSRSNIPIRFENSTIDDFDWSRYNDADGLTTKLKEYVRGYLIKYKTFKATGSGLYIWSTAKGTGKTFLASCIANQLMKTYGSVAKFVALYQLIDMVKSPDRYADLYGLNPMNTICTCEVLIIDDIGQKLTGQEWLGDILYQITDERYKRKLITIYTSNMEPTKLPYDDRIKDRVVTTTQAIPLPNVSIRQKDFYEERENRFKELGLIGEKNA